MRSGFIGGRRGDGGSGPGAARIYAGGWRPIPESRPKRSGCAISCHLPGRSRSGCGDSPAGAGKCGGGGNLVGGQCCRRLPDRRSGRRARGDKRRMARFGTVRPILSSSGGWLTGCRQARGGELGPGLGSRALVGIDVVEEVEFQPDEGTAEGARQRGKGVGSVDGGEGGLIE